MILPPAYTNVATSLPLVGYAVTVSFRGPVIISSSEMLARTDIHVMAANYGLAWCVGDEFT